MKTDDETLIVVQTSKYINSHGGIIGSYGSLKGIVDYTFYTFPSKEEKETWDKLNKTDEK